MEKNNWKRIKTRRVLYPSVLVSETDNFPVNATMNTLLLKRCHNNAICAVIRIGQRQESMLPLQNKSRPNLRPSHSKEPNPNFACWKILHFNPFISGQGDWCHFICVLARPSLATCTDWPDSCRSHIHGVCFTRAMTSSSRLEKTGACFSRPKSRFEKDVLIKKRYPSHSGECNTISS